MCIYKLGGLVQQLAEGRERGPAPDAPDAVDLALEVHGVPGMFGTGRRAINVSCRFDAVQRRQQELERVPGLEVHVVEGRQSLDIYDVVADVTLRRVYLLYDVDAGVAEDAEDLSQHARAVLVDDADALDRV